MTTLTDENLMAYADNQLDETLRKQVEAELKNDPEAQARLNLFEQSANALSSYDDVLKEPLPEKLLNIFDQSYDNQQPISTAEAPKEIKTQGKWLAWNGSPLAIAASLAFLAGITLGFIAPNAFKEKTQPSIVQAYLPHILEKQVTGIPESYQISNANYEIMVMGTYTTDAGKFCRSFEVTHLPGYVRIGMACRTTDQQWDVHMLVPPGSFEGLDKSTQQHYQTASNGRELIDATKRELNIQSTISLKEEQLLIDKGWK